MTAVTATEFARGFGKYKEEAQREPVAITSHGRISGYFISEHEFNELQRLRAFERRVYCNDSDVRCKHSARLILKETQHGPIHGRLPVRQRAS